MAQEDGEPSLISDLLDLTGAGLEQVDSLRDSFLLPGLRRILQEAGDLTEQYSAFDNFTDLRRGIEDPEPGGPIQ
jgi:FXSXX-COOH protein